jgi:hypothetical protein
VREASSQYTEAPSTSNTNTLDYRGLEGHHPPPLSQNISGNSTSFSDARNDAKRAILDLVIRGIQFDQLLDERTSSEDFLVGIWKEIGLALPARFGPAPKSGPTENAPPTVETSLPAKEIPRGQKPPSTQSTTRHRHPEQNLAPAVPRYGTVTLQDLSLKTASTADTTFSTAKSTQRGGNQQAERGVTEKSPLSSSINARSASQSKNSSGLEGMNSGKTSESNQPTLQTATTAGPPPAQEARKDRIARLMAQKAFKSAQNATSQPPPATDSTMSSVKNASSPSKLQAQNIPKDVHGTAQPSTELENSTTTPKSTFAEARPRARGSEATALALRKIEEQRQIAAAQKARSPTLRQKSPHNILLEVYDPSESSQITTPFELSDSSGSHSSRCFDVTRRLQKHEIQAVLGNGNASETRNSDVPVNTRGIPGLFMTSPVDQTIAQSQGNSRDTTSSMMAGPAEAQRSSTKPRLKRPVAADFDSGPTTSYGTFKRPFGQVREEPRLVIDVSDEDSSENEDVIILKAKAQKAPPQLADRKALPATTESLSQRQHSIKDLPPLSDFPPRRIPAKNFTHSPNHGLSTPPILYGNGKSSPSAFHDLKKKEEAIQQMQRKIAELEKKRASQGRSRVQSPKSVSSNTRETPLPQAVQAGQDGAAEKVLETTASLIPTNDVLVTQEVTLKEDSNTPQPGLHLTTELERKRQRRDQLQRGLSGMSADAEEARRHIAEHEREQKHWEAILKTKMDSRKILVAELEVLGIEVNENNIAELEIVKKKEELSDLKTEVAQDKDGKSTVFVLG